MRVTQNEFAPIMGNIVPFVPGTCLSYVEIQVAAWLGETDVTEQQLESAISNFRNDLDGLYNMACAAALCAQATGVRSSVASKRFVDHALKIMDRLKTLGYSKMDSLFQDPDFAILHGDPQFVTKLQNWRTLDEYWVANCEVTRGQFERFIKDEKVAVTEKPKEWTGIDEDVSPTEEHPAQQVSWYDAPARDRF